MIDGQIIKAISGFYYVDTGKGIYECRGRGILKKEKVNPLVGDNVKISILDEEEKKGIVEEIYERTTELIRPPIANVDKALIVFAIKEPSLNLSLLDRFLVLAEREGLDTTIIFTKVDLDDERTLDVLKPMYEGCGYHVIPVSTVDNLNIDEVKETLSGSVSVFAGPSGVGKSSLLNEIDENFKLQTGQVSEKIKRGRHTTRHTELHKLETGGMVADTAGFSSLSVDDIDEEELKEYFIEFEDYDCKFGGRCIHENEPKCGVKEAVEAGEISQQRYKSYLQLLHEIREHNTRKY
ncbi:MAG: ribosome small subunit-dependent GTPase A [Clostridioides sp.]|jgi:ribosome biogenesis GTPase|nr:ribosome small subunit-dependent GTPase A [Clostridioides sp.]